MDERVMPEVREAERQLRRALTQETDSDSLIDSLQRAQDAIDRARTWAAPPVKKEKKKKDEGTPEEPRPLHLS